MKLVRTVSLIALAFVLGGGLLAGTADAAVLDSVRVVLPDSGAIRGIDSLITTEVFFRTTHSDSTNITVWWWLGSKGAATDTVTDVSAFPQPDSLALAQGRGPWGAPLPVVAVRTTAKRSDTISGAGVIGDIQIQAGALDTVIVEQGPSVPAGISWKVTIRYTVDAGVGEQSGITAYAAVHDRIVNSPNLTRFTAPVQALRSRDVRVDGQRPVPSTQMNVLALASTGAVNVDGFTIEQMGESFTYPVLGTGDTLRIVYNLGTDADAVILLRTLKLSAKLGSTFFPLPALQVQFDSAFVVVQANQFPNIARDSDPDPLTLYLTDLAGNLSGAAPSDAVPSGVTFAANFLIDATAPVLEGVAAGDTLLPVANDTITDGGVRNEAAVASWMPFFDDKNAMSYNLAEALYTLDVRFDNADNTLDRLYTIPNSEGVRSVLADLALSAGVSRRVDLPNTQNAQAVLADSELYVYPGGPADAAEVGSRLAAVTDTSLATGLYSVIFKGTDVAGNVGPEVSRANVYVDVADIVLNRRFPTKVAFGPVNVARTDTVEKVTARVQFQLSEPADSVSIVYRGIAGADNGKSRTRKLTGSELTNTGSVQTFTVDSLVSKTTYVLAIAARDLVGNYTVAGPDTFYYDTTFVVPTIKRFRILAAKSGMEAADTLLAGSTDVLTIIADATTDGKRDAVTYGGSAVLSVTGARGLTVTGTGVTDLGGGLVQLDNLGWLAGQRTVTLKDTTAEDLLQVTVMDSTSAGGPFSGKVDSTIHYVPNVYSRIVVSAPGTVEQGTPFAVGVTLADRYGNRQITDNNKFLALSVNKLGVQLPNGPSGEIYVANGQTSFEAMSSMVVDSLVIRARDMAGLTLTGTSGPIRVVPAGAIAELDAPDTLIAEDYLGADGQGDQGGFVLLTWALSVDHGTLDGYRIYRQVQVTTVLDAEGNLVTLAEPRTAWMPWAMVDAVPGETIGRAIVATLDNVASLWAIAAERGNETTAKEAFDGVASISAAYELMAGTMAASKAAETGVPFATLTPDALSFIEKGVAPRMKTAGSVVQSELVQTAEAVRGIDNIAPVPVTMVRAMDTPNDGGSSIAISWTKSVSDVQVASSVPMAVGLGSTTYLVDGVAGYNVYRKIGQGEYTLVGQAGSGETSFADVSAVNGIRYTYKVSPFDLDNVAESTLERSAMAFRNNAVDAQGVPIRALFGTDNQVGFDDFFVFADNFGLSAGNEAFEPAFDLVSNARIDFEDFFAFADDFGRVAVGVAKVVPTMAGLNVDARLSMTAGAALPKVGEEVALQLSLADFAELKGYGFSISYDADKLEFVKVVREGDALGSGELASPQILSKTDGVVSVGAFGEAVSEGEVGLSVVFRTKTEIEESLVEVSESAVRDGNYAVNQVALPAPVQVQTRPEAFALKDNFPNPFNPATTIKYALPEGALVKLEVYNVVGQVVRTLVSGHQNAGRYVVQWDATNDSGHSLSSGIYFYRLQAGSEFTEVKKMLLLK